MPINISRDESQAAPTGAVEIAIDPALVAFIEMVAGEFSDHLDHPDIWQILSDLAGQDDGISVLQQLIHLRSLPQNPFLAKTMDLMIGVVTAVAIDPVAGLAQLKQLEVVHSLCPQVAGACFFVSRIGAPPEKSADLSTKFCDLPFTKFETLVDGTVAPCCSIWTKKRLGALDNQSFEEIWNSRDAQEMRESILDGSFRYCNKLRCTRIANDFLPERNAVSDPELRQIIDEELTVLETKPRHLFLAHDATCNLACPSCRSGIEVADQAQEDRFEKILHQVFHPLLESSSNLALSLSGQGDPWSSHHYRSILRYLADNDLSVKLSINTNALLMGPKRWSDFSGLAKYVPSVSVSIDACTPWVYEHVRRPGKFERLEENLRFIGAKYEAGEFRLFDLNATVQLDNYHELPALVDFAEDLKAKHILFYMIQHTGSHLSGSYSRKNIGDVNHPLHAAFLETLRDPKLERPIVHMFDVKGWRDLAFATRLPSDDLAADHTREDIYAAVEVAFAAEDHARAVALCAAGRIRFPQDQDLLRVEAQALETLGFRRQAEYRLRMAEALEQTETAAGAPVSIKRTIDRLTI